jgi:hypothetical protein
VCAVSPGGPRDHARSATERFPVGGGGRASVGVDRNNPSDATGRPLPTRERRQTPSGRRRTHERSGQAWCCCAADGRAAPQREQRVSINARDLQSM